MACSSIPALGITSDWLHQHCQSRSFLSLRRRACGFHAREIEESTVTSVLNKYGYLRDFMHIGVLRKEQKTFLVNLACGKNVFAILLPGFGLA